MTIIFLDMEEVMVANTYATIRLITQEMVFRGLDGPTIKA